MKENMEVKKLSDKDVEYGCKYCPYVTSYGNGYGCWKDQYKECTNRQKG